MSNPSGKKFRKLAVKAGVYHQTWINPETEDVHRQTVYITPEYLRKSAWSTMQMMKRQLEVPVCLDHQDDAYPKKTGEWLKDEMNNAVGLVSSVSYDPKTEEHVYEFEIKDPKIAEKIDQGIITKVSPNFHASFSPGDGTVWNNVVGHLALTFRPKDYHQSREPMATITPDRSNQKRFSVISMDKDSIVKLVPMQKLPFSVLASMAIKTSSGIKFSSADYDFKFPNRGAFMRWLGKRYRQTLKMSVAGTLGHTLYFAVIHAPIGGVTVNGRHYLGGQFIPNSHVEALPTEERDRVRAGSAARDKARAETAGKYIGAEEGHKEAIARHVGEHANAEMHPDDKKAAGRRWASLRGYHGDNALQQVAVLAGKEAAQLATLDPESDKAKHIKRRLRAYHEMAQMAKPPSASPMKAAASETTPKTSQEGIDQLIEKKTQEARKMIKEMTPRQAVEKLKETSTLGPASWDKITKQLEDEERERIKSGAARRYVMPTYQEDKALPPVIQGINAESQKAIETGVNPPAKINNPSIPATGVSGAATNAHYMTYSGRLSDKLAEIVRENHGQPIPEGVLTPARIKARFDIGVAPEDAAAEIYHDLAKPRLDDKNAALRRSPGEQLKSAVEASKVAVDRNKHASAMKEMAEASADADQAHEAKVAADRKQRIMDSLGDDHEHLSDEQKKELENDIAGLKKDDQEAEDAIASKHADYADSNIREANNRERDESIRRANEAHAEQKKKMLADNGLMMHNGSMKIDPENLDKAENLVARMKQAQAEGEEAIKVGLDPRGNPGKRTVLTKSGVRISRNDLKKNQREIENYERQIAYHKARGAGATDEALAKASMDKQRADDKAVADRASKDANSGEHITVQKLEPGLKYNAYKKHKEENPDVMHIYRMGDFYETFGDDARDAAKHLNLTLTSRDKEHPMAGFPHHALESHLRSLISKGKRIAIHDGTDGVGSKRAAEEINSDPPKLGSVPDAEPTPYAKEMKAKADKEAAVVTPSGFKSIDSVRKMSSYKNYDEAHADYLKHDADITEMEGKIGEKAKEIDKLRDLEYRAEKNGRADLAEKYAEKRKAKSEEYSEMMDKKLSSINKKNIARTERINLDPNIPDFVKHAGNQSKGYRGVADAKLYGEIEKPAIEWAKSKGYDEESAKHFADDLAQGGVQLDSAESVDKWMKRAATAVENKRKSQAMLDQFKKAKGYDLLHESRQAHWHDKITGDHGDDFHFNKAMKELDEHVEKQAAETAAEKKQQEDAKASKVKRERIVKDIGNLKAHHADISPEHMRDAVEHAVGSHHEAHSNFTPNKQYIRKPKDYHVEPPTLGNRYSATRAMAERGTWTDGRAMVRVPKEMQDKAKADVAARGDFARAPDTDTVFKMTDKIKKPAKVVAAYGDGTDDNKHKYIVKSEDGKDHRIIPQESHHAIMSLHPEATMHVGDKFLKNDMVVYRDKDGNAVGAVVPLRTNSDDNIPHPEIGEKVQLGDIAKPGPHSENDMTEEKTYQGTVIRHPGDDKTWLRVSGKGDDHSITGFKGRYKSKSHAIKAAKHILSFAHGTDENGHLIFKPKGDRGKQSSLLSMGVVHAPEGGTDMQGHHYLGGQFTPGEGAKTEQKADAPSAEEKKSFYRHADGHAKKLKLQPTIATAPGIGKVQGYKHGNMLIHKNKDRWQITHLPTGKRIGAATYKNDAIRKAYILHHGLDWNFAGEADPVHTARFKDVAKGTVPRDLNQGQLNPSGGIPGSHSDQRGLMESWIKHKPNYENAKKQYLATHGTFDENGNLKSVVANVDHWRDLIPGYNGINAPDTHPAAKHANEKFLDEMLAEMKGKGNGKVAILGGGGGSGKGTAVASHFDERDYPIRLDQTSSDYDSLMERVNKLKEHGMEPDLVFIDRRPREAWQGVVGRSANLMQKGEPPRVVPKRTAIEANINARKVAAKIAKEHPDIPLRVIDNHGGYNESRILKDRDQIVKHLDSQDYDIDKELKEADDHVSELERKGKLPEHVAKALRGT